MSHFSPLARELGRVTIDIAIQAYKEGRQDDANKFVDLAYAIFERSLCDIETPASDDQEPRD